MSIQSWLVYHFFILTFMLLHLQDMQALMSPSRVLQLNTAIVALDPVTLKTPVVSIIDNICIQISTTVTHM